MALINRIISMMIARMSRQDKERLIQDMTDKFLEDMTPEEKQKIVSSIMDKFLGSMTAEDKKQMMSQLTPKMMEGFDMALIMPQMLLSMMGASQQKGPMPGMMPMMASLTGKSKEANKAESPSTPEVKTTENFKRKPPGGKK